MKETVNTRSLDQWKDPVNPLPAREGKRLPISKLLVLYFIVGRSS